VRDTPKVRSYIQMIMIVSIRNSKDLVLKTELRERSEQTKTLMTFRRINKNANNMARNAGSRFASQIHVPQWIHALLASVYEYLT
jgi:hypothetical protein